MRTLLRHISRLLCLSLLLVTVQGKGQDVRLSEAPYGMTQNDTLMLGVKYNNDYAAAKAAFPKFIGELEYKGTSSTWSKYYQSYAFVREAQWRNDDYIGTTYYNNGLGCKAAIHVPHGVYKVNKKITAHQGGIYGGGSQGFINDPSDKSTGRAGGTTLVMDIANWIGNPGDTACFFEDLMWGDRSLSRYMEGVQIGGFKLEGRKGGLYEPSKRFVIGLRCWTRGENSMNHDLFIYNCDVGIWLGGQYHATYTDRDLSIFGCTMDGYRIVGGGHMRTYNLSTDNNPTLFHAVADGSYGFGNGFILDKFGGKNEDGHAEGQARVYSKGGLLADVEGGPSTINLFGGMWSHNQNEIPECLIRVKGQWAVNCWGMAYFTNPCINSIIHDRNTKTKRMTVTLDGTRPQHMSFLADYTGYWHSFGKADPPVISNVADARLAPLRRSSAGQPVGAWVQSEPGLPAYSITVPMIQAEGGTTPPPTAVQCKWDTTAWGACSVGIQSRSVTLSPIGCTVTPSTPKPAETRACTVTPPQTGGAAKLTRTNVTVTANTCEAVNVANVDTVQLVNFKPGEIKYGVIVAFSNGSWLQMNEPDGAIYLKNPTTSPQTYTKVSNVSGMKTGTTYNVTCKVPLATVNCLYKIACNQGGAQLCTIGTLTLK